MPSDSETVTVTLLQKQWMDTLVRAARDQDRHRITRALIALGSCGYTFEEVKEDD